MKTKYDNLIAELERTAIAYAKLDDDGIKHKRPSGRKPECEKIQMTTLFLNYNANTETLSINTFR
ncbi:MAG TPA: hypothetical protein VL020_04205, partial [Pseudomonadales bacterium]|nr:hypothetical protein [Pseudomonadales bacterium]